MTPWSAKPGLGTLESEAMVILLAGARRGMRVSLPHDVTWLVKGAALVSRRLPEPSAADEAACEEGPCSFLGHELGCPLEAKQESRQAAIAAARGGAR
jgi:hypothetical protein